MGTITNSLLAIIGIVFVLQMMSDSITQAFIFAPLLAFSEPWRFVTSMFLHGGLTHIFFNGYALLLFGSILETRVSKREYLILYFGAGLLGGLLYYATYVLGIIPPIPALGASGAIYGVLGACAVLFPDVKILFMGFVPMSMRWAAVAWFIMEFAGTFNIASGIASAAHLGGLIFGVAFAFYLGTRQRAPPEWQHEQSTQQPWEQE